MKQTGTAARSTAAGSVLRMLGLAVAGELAGERPRELCQWAIERWSIDALKGQRELHR